MKSVRAASGTSPAARATAAIGEVDVRRRQTLRRRPVDDATQHLALALVREGVGEGPERDEAGVPVLVGAMAEARDRPLLAQRLVEGPVDAVPVGLVEQAAGDVARRAVQRTGDRAEPGEEGVVAVGGVEAATRTANVEVASSWSARRTRIVLMARVRSSGASGARRRARRSAIEPPVVPAWGLPGAGRAAEAESGSGAGPASASTTVATVRRAARATASGRRSARTGSCAEASTTASRIRSCAEVAAPSGPASRRATLGSASHGPEPAAQRSSATSSKVAVATRLVAGTPR